MRRFKARGRLFPQFYSTDERVGEVSIAAWGLYSLMWVNADDQGRLSASPGNIKNACCPNREDITKADIPSLLDDLQTHNLIIVYDAGKSKALQFVDWWEVHGLQWAWPSLYPPPPDWPDHLRYKEGRDRIVLVNWPPSPESSPEHSGEPILSPSGSSSEEEERKGREEDEKRMGKGKGKGKGKGWSAESSGGHSGERSGEKISAHALTYGQILDSLTKNHQLAFGSVPDSRQLAQLRDLASEITPTEVTEVQIHDAFKEAVTLNKISLSYVRAILSNWLGFPKGRNDA